MLKTTWRVGQGYAFHPLCNGYNALTVLSDIRKISFCIQGECCYPNTLSAMIWGHVYRIITYPAYRNWVPYFPIGCALCSSVTAVIGTIIISQRLGVT